MPEAVRFAGFQELDHALQDVGSAVATQLTGEALLEGAEVIAVDARRRAPKRTGRLALAITTRLQRARTGAVTVTVGIARRSKVWYGALLEETGAAPHVETPRRQGGKRVLADADRALIYGRTVHHPGFRARPFLRPALDERAAAAVQRTGEVLWQKIRAHLAQRGR